MAGQAAGRREWREGAAISSGSFAGVPTPALQHAGGTARSTDSAVVVDRLVKSYGARRAVDDLSLEILHGEVFALLGPNGAGKTTTVETLEGFRRPDSGSVRVLGLDPFTDGARLKRHIGVMLQEGGVYPAMTPREALNLFGRFYEHARDTQELLTLVGLEDAAHTRYRRLSGGQKQRLSLALALVPRPQLVFLDEPTTGLDPQSRRATWGIIEQLKADGVTVLLTTHYLEEAERLADRIAIMDEGRLVALDTPTALVKGDASRVRIRTTSAVDPQIFSALPSAGAVRFEPPHTYLCDTSNAGSLAVEVATLLRDRHIPLAELRIGGGSLEDVFLGLTGKKFQE
jgi:ABC-2 type transport system ATP-binding protein